MGHVLGSTDIYWHSFRTHGARWNDLNFTYEVICSEQEAVYACIEGLINAAVNPLLTITESGGLRFSCRIPNYLHPNTDESRYFIHKHTPTAENPHERQVYLEIIGEKGYSCWDARYDIILGNLLDPPVISDNAILHMLIPFVMNSTHLHRRKKSCLILF